MPEKYNQAPLPLPDDEESELIRSEEDAASFFRQLAEEHENDAYLKDLYPE